MYLPRRLLLLIYAAVGVAVAWSHDYFERGDTWRQIVSAGLAILLWPLVLLGVDLHIKR